MTNDADKIMFNAALQNDRLDPHPLSACASGKICPKAATCRRHQYFLEIQIGETCIVPDPEACNSYEPRKFHELPGKEMEALFREAAAEEIAKTHAAGRPTTHGDAKGVYHLYPDGRKEYIKRYDEKGD